MNIQFPCKSCGKYIEVDGEWANRLVQCPYCSSTVTAPERSEAKPEHAGEGPQITPVATSPVNESGRLSGGDMPAQWGDSGVVYGQTQPRPRKVLPWIGLGLACLGLVVGLIFIILGTIEVYSHMDANTQPGEVNELMQKALEAQEGWAIKVLLWMGLGFVLGGLLWLAGLVCGIVSLVRTTRCIGGWLTLCVCGLPLILMLLSVIFGL